MSAWYDAMVGDATRTGLGPIPRTVAVMARLLLVQGIVGVPADAALGHRREQPAGGGRPWGLRDVVPFNLAPRRRTLGP